VRAEQNFTKSLVDYHNTQKVKNNNNSSGQKINNTNINNDGKLITNSAKISNKKINKQDKTVDFELVRAEQNFTKSLVDYHNTQKVKNNNNSSGQKINNTNINKTNEVDDTECDFYGFNVIGNSINNYKKNKNIHNYINNNNNNNNNVENISNNNSVNNHSNSNNDKQDSKKDTIITFSANGNMDPILRRTQCEERLEENLQKFENKNKTADEKVKKLVSSLVKALYSEISKNSTDFKLRLQGELNYNAYKTLLPGLIAYFEIAMPSGLETKLEAMKHDQNFQDVKEIVAEGIVEKLKLVNFYSSRVTNNK
jgi:hypothetical protein